MALIGWIYYWLPSAIQDFCARAIAFVLLGLKVRVSVVEQNLELAFPGDSPEAASRRRELRSVAYRHLGRLALEVFLVFGPLKNFVQKHVELRGKEIWEEARKQGRGVLFLSSHVGNWEIMAAGGGVRGIEILLVTKRLKPAWLHRAIERGRAKCGVYGTYEPRTYRDVLARLKQNGTVGFVLDQYAGPPVGVRVPFMGTPVGTNTALATIAKRTGAVVLPVVNYRLPDGKFVVEIQKPVSWSEDENPQRELAANTAAYARILEQHVKDHPDQWLWSHRRFKGDLSPLRAGEWDEGRPRR